MATYVKFGRKAEAEVARGKGLQKAVGSHANLMQIKEFPITHRHQSWKRWVFGD